MYTNQIEAQGKIRNIPRTHYEGQRIYAKNISKYELELKNLFYAGEKNSHMWWVEFEQQLNLVLKTYVKH